MTLSDEGRLDKNGEKASQETDDKKEELIEWREGFTDSLNELNSKNKDDSVEELKQREGQLEVELDVSSEETDSDEGNVL